MIATKLSLLFFSLRVLATSISTTHTGTSTSGSPTTTIVPLYSQCGGRLWTGSTNCGPDAVCVSINENYSECEPRYITQTACETTFIPIATLGDNCSTTRTVPTSSSTFSLSSIPPAQPETTTSPHSSTSSPIPERFEKRLKRSGHSSASTTLPPQITSDPMTSTPPTPTTTVTVSTSPPLHPSPCSTVYSMTTECWVTVITNYATTSPYPYPSATP